MNQQANFQDVIDAAREVDEQRIDYMANTRNLHVADTGQLGLPEESRSLFQQVNGDISPDGPARMYLTRHALGQIASRLGLSYGRAFFNNNPELPQHIIADVLNHYLRLRDPMDLLIRQWGNDIRGICSDRYMIMDHSWILQTAAQFLTAKDGGGNSIPGQWLNHVVVAGWRVGPDTMDVKVIMSVDQRPDGDSPYGLGVCIRNGTVANGSVQIESLIMRTKCTNSIRYRNLEWSIRHLLTKEPLAAREASIIAAMAEGFKTGYELADRMIRARTQRLPNLHEVIGQFVGRQGWNQGIEPVINAGTEGDYSLAGLVNGLTFATQPSNHRGALDEETASDIEALAGDILMGVGDGATSGDHLAQSLFRMAGSKTHQYATIED